MDLLADILHLAAQVGIVAVLAHVVVRALRRVRRRVRLKLRLSLRLGLATDAFERLKERVHKAMERRGDVRAGRAVLLGKLAGGGTGAVLACWQRAPACTCICSPP